MTRSRKGHPSKSGLGRNKNGSRTLACGNAGVVGIWLMGSSIAALRIHATAGEKMGEAFLEIHS